jgi:sterol desaturase/sphingolipid hydroxylase (fatty acid hydroxylase superfamily)
MPEMSAQIAWILAGMALLAGVETWIPLRARRRAHRDHLAPNLTLTALTFGTNALLSAALVAGLAALESRELGLLHALGWPAWAAIAAAVIGLDFATWVAHVSMHRVPAFWRCHRVHHADRELDVTTTFRQHPGETLIRAGFLAAFAAPLGVGPAAFAFYRTLSAANALLEHANLRVPRRLDGLLSQAVATPNYHKVHHSRRPQETDTNYGNLLSLFDRLFACFTPSERGLQVEYGLEGFDAPETQTVKALLCAPFREVAEAGSASGARGAEVAAST